jgi:hypothetical protein
MIQLLKEELKFVFQLEWKFDWLLPLRRFFFLPLLVGRRSLANKKCLLFLLATMQMRDENKCVMSGVSAIKLRDAGYVR